MGKAHAPIPFIMLPKGSADCRSQNDVCRASLHRRRKVQKNEKKILEAPVLLSVDACRRICKYAAGVG
jgi:hypothetical protein